MAIMSTLFSFAALFLIHTSHGQTGAGCSNQTPCPGRGEVRVDAQFDAFGVYAGGCYCSVPVYNPQPTTAPPTPVQPPSFPTFYRPPTTKAPHPTMPPRPVPNPGTPTQNGQRPVDPILPGLELLPSKQLVGVPTVAGPSGGYPTTQFCELPGDCSCPQNTKGSCTITCGGIDGCKDSMIQCNNDGYPCRVECIGEQACISSTIIGPDKSSLTVNCVGDTSCEGSMAVFGEASTDVSVTCNGLTSCKGTMINFGTRTNSVACNGEPDSCDALIVNLQHNAHVTPGNSFKCTGLFCPATLPANFNNVNGPQGAVCGMEGNCGCDTGVGSTNCEVTCDGGLKACSMGRITCNPNHDCVVNCVAQNSCENSVIIGPMNGALTVNCMGAKSCGGSTEFDGTLSTDMTIKCDGREACKGSVNYLFGSGVGKLECNGQPDSCQGGASFKVGTGRDAAFSCSGRCPANVPGDFNNRAAFTPIF